MKKILYLSFYFEPDLCAGSFRNTPLAYELAFQLKEIAQVEVYTTMPNRYSSYNQVASNKELKNNLIIHRIKLPKHKSGLLDQIYSFITYYIRVKRLTKSKNYDLIFASSSRLFTAYLGYSISKFKHIPYYLDIRDIFYDSMSEIFRNRILKKIILPILKHIEKTTFSNATHINLISGGFIPYFLKYDKPNTTYFTNGIDNQFLNISKSGISNNSQKKRILYAGNIGEGQGLDKLIPELANNFREQYEFHIIGDGGAKAKLVNKITELKCSNVILKPPLSRSHLLEEYNKADFFLIHLNNYPALKKVLPSKVFELGTYDKPIIAGVDGFAAMFIIENLPNVILFKPCNVDECTYKLRSYEYKLVKRTDFIKKFKRSTINSQMAKSIKSYL